MKKSINNRLQKFILNGFLLLGLTAFLAGKTEAKSNNFAVSFQVFYDELMPYGDWVDDPHYGFIWIPYVEPGFQPYRTNGHWVMSRFGNTWVSMYDWGWAPFHYGRWFFSDHYGWAWVPGYEWGPAWVDWRTGGGYYGWAPLAPRVQFYASVRFPVYSHWVFVPRRRLLSRNIYNYYIPRRNINVVYNRTTVINNTYIYNNRTYIAGPSRTEIQRVTRRNVPVYEVSNTNRPGRAAISNNSVQMYKPEIRQVASQSRGQASAARPSRVISSNEFRNNRSNAGTSPTTAVERRTSRTNEGTVNSPRNNGANRSAAPNNRQVSPERTQTPNQKGAVAPNNNRSQNQRQSTAARQVQPSQNNQRQAAPAQGQVGPAKAPQQRQVAPSTQQRQVRNAPQMKQASPSSSSARVATPPAKQQSSPKVSNSRSQVRSSAGTTSRSQRNNASSSTRSNSRRGGN